MLSEFVAFLHKTNALALAVAVIIGTAVGKVVTSIVGDLLMPLIGLALGGGDWRGWLIPLKTAPDGKVLAGIGVGSFLGAVVDFVIIAAFVFLATKSLLEPPPPAAATKTCPACAETIVAKATRCKHCASPV